MTSTIHADKIMNSSGDQDSGVDLLVNDQVKLKTANTDRVTVTDATTTVANDLAVNTIKHTGGTTGITIDSGGRVIINNATRPRFEAGFNNDDMDNVGNADGSDYRITFTQELVDIGGCWDGSHTFTAPVDGLYMFYSNLYSNYTSNNSRTQLALYVGGVRKYKNANANWETETTATLVMPIYLSATNTVDIRMSLYDSNGTSNTFQIYRNTIYSNFGGYLIG
tara:strand:- start:17442 stop:18110 length:669 start_codon:yes stop_codon:yes gene_type:complete